MILEIKWFCKLLGVRGITLWPFIIVNDKTNKVLINHEKIHYQQEKELWVIPFYFLYFKDYFHNRKIYTGSPRVKHWWSYRNIYFEKEAYANQSNLEYLDKRKYKSYKKYQ